MIFNSLAFFIFFPVVTTGYFLLPHRFRWAWLLLASCFFYMAFIPIYILILFATILVDYVAGILIAGSSGKRRKMFLIASLVSNVGFLAWFKYYGFVATNVAALAQLVHWNYTLPLLHIILPIGLSFHTFQAMSYTIEVYRGKQPAERHLGIYALYVMFFPQLVAGPIERPQNLIHQFYEKHIVEWPRIASGLRLMLWGFFKKIVIADNCAAIVNRVFDYPTQFTGLPLIIGTILFAFQIYADFSGYSDIAIGAARVMGFTLMKNFDRPYASKSIGEFWRRWHISLSSWFRDYVYIPLGGNRAGKWRQSFNLLVVFLISGLWHGAAWTYVAWGTLLGVYLIVSIWTKSFREKLIHLIRLDTKPRVHGYIQTAITFFLICLGWIFFRAKSLVEANYIISHLFSGLGSPLSYFGTTGWLGRLAGTLGTSTFSLLHIVVAVAFMEYGHIRLSQVDADGAIAKWSPWIRWTIYDILMLWIVFFGYFGERPFIYFQF